jgi:hypothetical protein
MADQDEIEIDASNKRDEQARLAKRDDDGDPLPRVGFIVGGIAPYRTPSQWFFGQCGLTPSGREPDFVPPKPLPSRAIKKLGAALDRLEPGRYSNEANQHRFYVLAAEYGQALGARNLYQRCKLENSKRVPTQRDAVKLRGEMYSAMANIDELEELGSDFHTYREFSDANSASAFAISAYEIAQEKFRDADRQARADRASNIVRKTYRRKPYEVHL